MKNKIKFLLFLLNIIHITEAITLEKKYNSKSIFNSIKNIKDKKEFDNEVLYKSKSAILKFYSPLCGACQEVEPIFKKVARDLKKIKFFQVNIDKSPDLAKEYEIDIIPTIIFIKEGKKLSELNENISENEIKARAYALRLIDKPAKRKMKN